MTYLALLLKEVLDRRAALRQVQESALHNALTEEEREDIQHALDAMDKEIRALEMRLEALRSGPASGGTGG